MKSYKEKARVVSIIVETTYIFCRTPASCRADGTLDRKAKTVVTRTALLHYTSIMKQRKADKYKHPHGKTTIQYLHNMF